MISDWLASPSGDLTEALYDIYIWSSQLPISEKFV